METILQSSKNVRTARAQRVISLNVPDPDFKSNFLTQLSNNGLIVSRFGSEAFMTMDAQPEVRPSSKDQRRHARLDIALAVNYAIQQAGGEPSEMAETLSSDISASGLRLMTVAPLENGSILNLEITLPEDWPGAGDPIRASGEVVWQNKISDFSFETGAVIKHMEESDKKRLMSFVFDQMSRLVGTLSSGGTNGAPNAGTPPDLLN